MERVKILSLQGDSKDKYLGIDDTYFCIILDKDICPSELESIEQPGKYLHVSNMHCIEHLEEGYQVVVTSSDLEYPIDFSASFLKVGAEFIVHPNGVEDFHDFFIKKE